MATVKKICTAHTGVEKNWTRFWPMEKTIDFGCLKHLHSPFLPQAILLATAKTFCISHIEMEKLLIWMLKKTAQPISATSDTIDNS